MPDGDDLIFDVARLIWRREITVGEFYQALGVDLETISARNVDDVMSRLSGIFDGWNNTPEVDPKD